MILRHGILETAGCGNGRKVHSCRVWSLSRAGSDKSYCCCCGNRVFKDIDMAGGKKSLWIKVNRSRIIGVSQLVQG